MLISDERAVELLEGIILIQCKDYDCTEGPTLMRWIDGLMIFEQEFVWATLSGHTEHCQYVNRLIGKQTKRLTDQNDDGTGGIGREDLV
jgi:hypothetical protein